MDKKASVIVAAALVLATSSSGWAGSKSLGCKLVDNVDPVNRYMFRLANASKPTVPAGAKVTVKISAKRIRGITPGSVNTTFHYDLASALEPHATADEPGSAFAKSCTASAKW
jgi:hypothetical protein